jgi:hypothetical protein
MKHVAIAAVALFCYVGAASAATLTPLQGQVLLNRGGGYQPISGTVEVKAGDSILVNPDGLAQLAYDDCATYEIKPGDVVYVSEKEAVPCAGGVVDGAAGLGGLGANGLVVGGLAVAVGVGVVAGVSSGSDSPSSP